MKTYKIHLIRNALTKGNIQGKYIGHTDEPLCDEGIIQLKDLIENNNYPYVETVLSSPLLRCTQTAEFIYSDMKPIIIQDLIECNFGAFEDRTADELTSSEEFSLWLKGGPDAAPPFGESNREFSNRIRQCFIKIVDGLIKTGTTKAAIITHGGVIMTILSSFGIPELSMHEWLTPSCCGFTLCITPSLWSKIQKVEIIADIPE